MGFLILSNEYRRTGATQVDNIFLHDYLPEADGDDVRVYLYGLMCASSGADTDVTAMAEKLQLSVERVSQGFAYWEEKGLVRLSATSPLAVTYLSVRAPEPPTVKYNTRKYQTFVEEAVRIYPERVLSPNDFNAYFELMHSEKIDVNAMLLIMQYCKDLGGGKTGTKYVCAVARAWAELGFLTEKQVAAHIGELENNNEEIRTVFDALGVKRGAQIEDRQMYYRWQEYGFGLDAILTAARSRKKKGGMEKLDAYVEELHKANAHTAEEVAQYTDNKEKLHDLAVEISKNLGVYYSNTENITEIYILPWIGSGFEPEALLKISKYCFLRNVHTFDVMKQMVEKIRSLGLFTAADISSYVDRQIAADDQIRKVYEKCGYVGTVTNRDRDSYRTWIEWGYEEETVLAVAATYSGMPFPMQSLARMMGTLRNAGIFTKEEALKFIANKSKPTQSTDNYMKHQYSDEDLKNALVNFDNWE